MDAAGAAALVLAALRTHGLLLVQDKAALNLVTIVTGDRPKGSWWAHPEGRLVFAVLTALGDHRDVLFAKLLGGKVTLVHRRLWPDVLAMALSGGPWQHKGLPAPARKLLARVTAAGAPVPSTGKAVKDLETRLLIHTWERHSETGRHVLMAEAWPAWAVRRRVKPRALPRAQVRLEKAAAGINAAPAVFPWA